jgi:hypothetical protein
VPSGDDVSAVDLTDDLEDGDQIAVHKEEIFVTDDVIAEFEIAPGEDVFMIGLFVAHHGGSRNKPVVRFGNLAMTADPLGLVKQPNAIDKARARDMGIGTSSLEISTDSETRMDQ